MGNTMRISICVLAAIALANIASISGQDWFGSKLATGNLTGSIFMLVLMRASAGRETHTHRLYNSFVFGIISHRRSSNMASTNCAAGLVLFWVLLSVMVTPITAPLRDTAPNRDDNYHFLTGVTEWNGIPRRDFRHLWFASLIVALGAIFKMVGRSSRRQGMRTWEVLPIPHQVESQMLPPPSASHRTVTTVYSTRY